MKKPPFKVLSLFDGISCFQIAFRELGIKNYIAYVAEINKHAIRVTQHHFPNTNQVGNIVELDPYDYRDVDLVVGGSPCQSMSRMGKGKGITTKSGIIIATLKEYLKLKAEWRKTGLPYLKFFNESALYWEWDRMLKGIQAYNPHVLFLLENVKSPDWEFIITNSIGVKPEMINSSCITAQNRERNYWSNIIRAKIPSKNITIGDVIPKAQNGAGYRGVKINDGSYLRTLTVRTDGKANCLVTAIKGTGYYETTKGKIELITPEQAEALQTLPIGYTNVGKMSNSARYKMIGNSWTVDVIKYFFKNIKKNLKQVHNPMRSDKKVKGKR